MSTTAYWIKCDLISLQAFAIAVERASPDAQPAVTGFAYRELPELQEFLSHAIDVTHGDADAILMGAEMQGKDDLWLDISADVYHRLAAMGNVMGCDRAAITHARIEHGQAFALTDCEVVADVTHAVVMDKESTR